MSNILNYGLTYIVAKILFHPVVSVPSTNGTITFLSVET